ncbi:hypothetical protein MGYG_07890 [Nannizzia gypsea CBS 118893]|uniref:Uncharacterized protein n=1 Tax=Arthroderma gypseum (strain ATCC MYA-4604 / CBS 118893) TaxID=535722 RepID=E4V4G4_ARTGP|nr:hypothetical protein MGYG_07890 [Nannizzia gypsea CBS 118893]EFR04888.1 hypothetical protein MGYG_07890 [Nannizzia gypsea CBS 118893]
MVDVRELLRNELASRQISSSKTAKKRRHGLELEPARKKPRADTEDKPEDESTAVINTETELPERSSPTRKLGLNTADTVEVEPEIDTEELPPAPDNQGVDEDEWAAFEREVAQPSREQPPTTINTSVTISAAPVSAAELESREREDRETVAKNREAALLGDREDATRFLEEEFDEMEELDQRVKRLKQMRDEIRRKREEESRRTNVAEKSGLPDDNPKIVDGSEEEEEEGDDDEEENWDDWGFR